MLILSDCIHHTNNRKERTMTCYTENIPFEQAIKLLIENGFNGAVVKISNMQFVLLIYSTFLSLRLWSCNINVWINVVRFCRID